MAVQISHIINGVFGKIKGSKPKNRFTPISWMREKILKHEEDKKIKTIQLGNIKLTYKRPYEILHTYKDLFEKEIYNFSATTPSPFIIDCGANIGLGVLYFKSLYPQATILAFEPDKENFALLQKNVQLNQLTNVECRQSAVWIYNGEISFSSAGTEGSQITKDNNGANTIQIKAERLADIIKNQKVDFLKIDIEGAELEVIKDCEPHLKNVKYLFVEYHGKADETEKLYQLLESVKNHYKVYIKMAADNLTYPFVTKSTGGAFDVQLNIFCYQ